eukprot:gnl/Hemi2/15273_TR5142_c0_g28_i1.p1 gnl/Hemi2/15273_TR5142_c0_g28~~gnl/Hemi2/15273_TR5142_c0_g28_i1.p1  ORF type:complete len:612 (-),score=123.20 gnl/Hemi2/15273_TR5142_c0_g28_i1:223-2058(-)
MATPSTSPMAPVAAFLKSVVHTVSQNRLKAGVAGFILALGLGAAYRATRRGSKKLDRSPSSEVVELKKSKAAVDGLFIKRLINIIHIVVPSIYTREFGILCGLTVLLFGRTMLSILLADIMGGNGKALVERRLGAFIRGVCMIGAVAIPASMVNSGLNYTINILALRFRKRLSEHIHDQYLSNKRFYTATTKHFEIENADHRIAQDIDKFSTCLSNLYSNIFKPVLDVVLYTVKLSFLVGKRGPIFMFAYYLISSILLRRIMPPFAKLTARLQKLEGDFRGCHTRLIQHAEEIAFYNGGEKEKLVINRSYAQLDKHAGELHGLRGFMGIFDNFLVKYGPTMIGYLVIGMPVFLFRERNFADKTSSDLTRDYIRNSQLLLNLARGIGSVVMLYRRTTELAGYTERVAELMELLSKISDNTDSQGNIKLTATTARTPNAQYPPQLDFDNYIKFEHVDIYAPDGDLLLKDLSFEVQPGKNTLISGPNGSGKSSLFRVLGQLWPLSCGSITKPAVRDMFYIPQRPYLAEGTLRENVTYPHFASDVRMTDQELSSLMDIVNLTYLLEREDGWDAVLRLGRCALWWREAAFGFRSHALSQAPICHSRRVYQRCQHGH